MDAKNTIFESVDLFHSLMDFLPNGEPVNVMAVCKGWKTAMKNYKFPNYTLSLEDEDEYNLSINPDFRPCSIFLDRYSNLENIRVDFIRKIYCSYNLKLNLNLFVNLTELKLSIDSSILSAKFIPSTIQKFQLIGYSNFTKFDGIGLTNLIKLNVYDTLLTDLILPPNLKCLYMPSKWRKFPNPGYFPESLTELKFGYVEGPILAGALPPYLESLEIDSGFNSAIERDIIPSTISLLNLGSSFESALTIYTKYLRTFTQNNNNCLMWPPSVTKMKLNSLLRTHPKLPSTLTDLEFKVSHSFPLIPEFFSCNIIFLKICAINGYSPVFHKLPPCLKSLSLYMSRSSMLRENDLPDSITYLKLEGLEYCFNLKRNLLPSRLEALSLQCSSSSFEDVSLPGSLTLLDLAKYRFPFRRGVLPNSLKTLKLCSNYLLHDLCRSWFPDSLDYIDIGRYKLGIPRRIG